MLIDARPILRGETDMIEIDHTVDAPGDFDDISFGSEIAVKGRIRNMSGYITLALHASVPFSTHCSRCWKEIDRTFELDFTKQIADKKVLQNEDTDDYLLIEDGTIDIDTPLLEAIMLEFPTVFLCKADCKGLCFKCGKDLNEGDCGCPKKEIDPRLEKLSKLLDK